MQILVLIVTILNLLTHPLVVHAQTPTPNYAPSPNKCNLPPEDQSTLSQYAQSRKFNIGGTVDCINPNAPQHAICEQTVDKEYQGMFSPYADAWYNFEPKQGTFDYARLDNAIAFARTNTIRLHFYHLIWSSYAPTWLFPQPVQPNTSSDPPLNCGTMSKTDAEQLMKTYIQTTMTHAGNAISVWNVVNEAFSTDGSLRQNCFYKIIGPDYIDKAFTYAGQVSSHGTLVLSDYFGIARMPIAEVDGFFSYVKAAKARGVPIEAVGLENHLMATNGNQFSQGYLDDLNYYFQKAQDANVQVLITEMDVYQAGHSQADVATVYKNVTAMCLKYTNCISLETWGISDKYSWLRSPRFGNLPDAQPLLFNDTYERKPAYYGVMDALREDTTRPCISNTPTPTPKPGDLNGDGKVDINDFNLVKTNFGNPYTIFDYNNLVGNFEK